MCQKVAHFLQACVDIEEAYDIVRIEGELPQRIALTMIDAKCISSIFRT